MAMKATDLPGVRIRGSKFEASVKVGTGPAAKQESKSFPLTATAREIEDWQDAARLRLKGGVEKGTLADDVQKFLSKIPERSKRWRDFENNFRPWVAALGTKARCEITRDDCRDVLDGLIAKGLAESTTNHIRQALLSLWKDRDGVDAVCPAAKITKRKEPRPERRALDPAMLDAALEEMSDCITKARIGLILTTGARPCEISWIERDRVKLDGPAPYVEYRSGKHGTDYRMVPLTPSGVRYMRMLLTFDDKEIAAMSSSSMAKVLRNCFIKAQIPSDLSPEQRREAYERIEQSLVQAVRPTGKRKWRINPYVCRHTCFTQLRSAGADLADVAEIAGHKSPQTTKRYAPVVNEKLVAAMHRIERQAGAEDGKAGNGSPV